MPDTVDAVEVEKKVRAALESFGADAGALARDARLEELNVDSLDLAELSQIVEEEYGVRLESSDVERIQTVGDAVDLIVDKVA